MGVWTRSWGKVWGCGLGHRSKVVWVWIRSWEQGVGVWIRSWEQGVGLRIRSWEQVFGL